MILFPWAKNGLVLTENNIIHQLWQLPFTLYIWIWSLIYYSALQLLAEHSSLSNLPLNNEKYLSYAKLFCCILLSILLFTGWLMERSSPLLSDGMTVSTVIYRKSTQSKMRFFALNGCLCLFSQIFILKILSCLPAAWNITTSGAFLQHLKN